MILSVTKNSELAKIKAYLLFNQSTSWAFILGT